VSGALSTNQRAVLVLVDADQAIGTVTIAHQAGLRPDRVSRALAALEQRGYVTSSHGRWYSTALGQQRLERQRRREAAAVIATYGARGRLHYARVGASRTLCGVELHHAASGSGITRSGTRPVADCRRCQHSAGECWCGTEARRGWTTCTRHYSSGRAR